MKSYYSGGFSDEMSAAWLLSINCIKIANSMSTVATNSAKAYYAI